MPLSVQIIVTLLVSALAGYVGGRWRPGFAFSQMKKRLRELEQTTADLELNFDSLLASHKALRSRAGMRELRAREKEPGPENKAEIRARLFGNAAGPAFAKRMLELAKSNE
jgi:hypothetical protein